MTVAIVRLLARVTGGILAIVAGGLLGLAWRVGGGWCRARGHRWAFVRRVSVAGFRPIAIWRCSRCARLGAPDSPEV